MTFNNNIYSGTLKIIINPKKVDKGLADLAFVSIILILIAISFFLWEPSFSADVTIDTENTTSNVTIEKNVAISRSNNLTVGILFGTVTVGSNDNNATGDFNSTEHSQYWIQIDSTTNVPVDVCIQANDTMRSGTYQIALTGYTWSNSTTNVNSTEGTLAPISPSTTAITQSWAKTIEDAGGTGSTVYNYYRFHLDISSGTYAGTYTNEIQFKATENTTAC